MKNLKGNVALALVAALWLCQTACTRKTETVQPSTPETQVTTDAPQATPEVTAQTETPVVVEEKSEKKVATRRKKGGRVSGTISGNQAPQTEVAGSPEVLSSTAEVQGPPSPTSGSRLSGNFQMAHSELQKSGDRSFSEFLAEGDYQLSNNSSVGVGQTAQKLYEIAPHGEREFLLGDTRLHYNYNIESGFLDSKWSVEVGTTLPVSQESRDAKHITQPYVSFEAKRMFGDRVELKVSPIAYYRFNSNATNDAGVPHHKMGFGGAVELDWRMLEAVSLIGFGNGTYRLYEQFDFRNESPAGTGHFNLGVGALWLRIRKSMRPADCG